MAVTGFKASGTQANSDRGASNPAWSNPANAAASDDSRATVALINVQPVSDYLRLTNFGFTNSDIPSGSTILGIEVNIEASVSASVTHIEETVILRTTSGQVGSNDASNTLTTTDTVYTHGGATSLWGTTWVDTDIVGNSNFGIDIAYRFTAGTNSVQSRVDYVEIRVYYTPPFASGVHVILQAVRRAATR